MPIYVSARSTVALFLLATATVCAQTTGVLTRQPLATLHGATHAAFVRSDHEWGIEVTGAGLASVRQAHPVTIELFTAPGHIETLTHGYSRLEHRGTTTIALASVPGPDGSSFDVRDEWSGIDGELHLNRSVTVHGSSKQAFLSAITLLHPQLQRRDQVDYFAPGVIYGSPAHLTPVAIGGREIYGPGGHGMVQIREDRLPAPMFGVRFQDGSSLTLLDAKPDGATTREESHDTEIHTLVDERLHFGAIGIHLAGGAQEQGFWFPGTEGEVTYRGATYPGGQEHKWRRRYHPIRDGLRQHYELTFRFGHEASFPQFMRDDWRWAWSTLKPQIVWQNFPVIEKGILNVLAMQAIMNPDGSAFEPNHVDSAARIVSKAKNACLGFTGKQFESAEYLLADSLHDPSSERAQRERGIALRLYKPFLATKVDPPAGECLNIADGGHYTPATRESIAKSYLRSYTDAIKSLLRAYHREAAAGHMHPEWLAWSRLYADWLLTQQQSTGGFPRAWKPGTDQLIDSSPNSSYNPIPMLVLLSRETHDARYLNAAIRAGEFAWSNGQATGQFVGGTIDNPDILDKEAGTLSTEAYLALEDATHDPKWRDRARAAADYAETYIYLWNVPMPADEDDSALGWKKGVPTTGTQLIATGHSLTDDYMAFDADEFARLWKETGDTHYRTVSSLLLHDTKNMIDAPEHPYDLLGPGWQQEHWSFAPVRGFGLHRRWLPWVATSQLNGMIGLREYDPALYSTFIREGVR